MFHDVKNLNLRCTRVLAICSCKRFRAFCAQFARPVLKFQIETFKLCFRWGTSKRDDIGCECTEGKAHRRDELLFNRHDRCSSNVNSTIALHSVGSVVSTPIRLIAWTSYSVHAPTQNTSSVYSESESLTLFKAQSAFYHLVVYEWWFRTGCPDRPKRRLMNAKPGCYQPGCCDNIERNISTAWTLPLERFSSFFTFKCKLLLYFLCSCFVKAPDVQPTRLGNLFKLKGSRPYTVHTMWTHSVSWLSASVFHT